MIKLKLYTAFLLILFTMASCRFSEECNYTGGVELSLDWESLWGNLQKPDSLTVLFYKEGKSPVRKGLYGHTTDTVYNSIPSGSTNMIIFNKPDKVQSHILSELSNAELRLPTYFEGNIRAVEECPMICEVNNDIVVPIEEIVRKSISPLPIVKQLTFVVNVIREGVIGEPTTCSGSLSGISTGYSLSQCEATRSKATVFFPLSRKTGSDTFSHSFFVLGVNPDRDGMASISKKLSISITLDDGEARSADFELTDSFNEFISNIYKCEVNVTITALSTDITIVGWKQGTWHNIVIQ